MNYYIYDNWKPKDRESPMIHKWNCGHCHMGFGKRKYANRGENGVWIGPFEKFEYAKSYFSMKFSSQLNECECTNK